MALIDFTSVRTVTETYLDVNFTTVPTKFENVGLLEDAPEFIALRDKSGQAETLALGEIQSLTQGVMLIDIYTARGLGTQRSRTIATELAALLSNQTVSFISFAGAELHTVGEIEGYFQQVLQIPYQYVYGGSDVLCNP